MDPLQEDQHLPNDGPTPDRRRGGLVGHSRRWLIALVRSRWIASFIVAFAVSWSFHQVDEIGQHRLERQQRVLTCTIEDVAKAQTAAGPRVAIKPILQQCEKQVGK